MNRFIATTISKYIKENYPNIHRSISYLEKIFNVKISKLLGDDSIGVAYLTHDSKVLKITPSKPEYTISNYLLKNSNIHFPKIYNIKKLDDTWYGIHKEYIPMITDEIKNDYLELETIINEWLLDYDDSLFMHKLIEISNDNNFLDYLSDEHHELIYIYKQIMEIVEFVKGLVKHNVVDIHVENLGLKNNTIILFDY